MERLADIPNYHSVFGEDPHFVHLQDGHRAEFAHDIVQEIERQMRIQAWERGELQEAGLVSKPLCPGCTVTIAFNALNFIAKRYDYNPGQIADAMIRLWTEVKERNEFLTGERSGILPVQEATHELAS